MKKSVLIFAAALLMSLSASHVFAQQTPPAPTPAQAQATTAAATGDLGTVIDGTTFASALKNAHVDSVLKTPGPYTVFAPNNEAFAKLSAAKQDSLAKNPTQLSAILRGHIVTGKYAKADVIKALIAGKGTTTLKTIDGQTLTLSVNEKKNLVLTDSQGNSAQVISFDAMATNGVVHGINAVLVK